MFKKDTALLPTSCEQDCELQDDGDDWDQEDARERRKQLAGENRLAADLADVSQMTTAQMMRQYKRKLATIGGDDDAPATPVRRPRQAARSAPEFAGVRPHPSHLINLRAAVGQVVRCTVVYAGEYSDWRMCAG
jgi:hypothetical protein